MRPLALCVVGAVMWASPSHAEMPWSALRGRVTPRTRLEAFVGTRSAGAAFVRPDVAQAAVAAELAIGFIDRTADLRAMRVWQVTPTQAGTVSLMLGGSVTLGPVGPVDVGLGPHTAVVLALGGSVLTVDLSVSVGAEVFVRTGVVRSPWRAGLGLHFSVGQFGASVQVRGGADIFPGQSFVGRGEAVLSLQWLGLDASSQKR
jgi:hypothetical protein